MWKIFDYVKQSYRPEIFDTEEDANKFMFNLYNFECDTLYYTVKVQ